LFKTGYLTHDDPHTLTKDHLTIKGILATEVNEGHPLLMSDLYHSRILHGLQGEDLITVLACFHEKKVSVPITDLDVSQEAYDALLHIQKLSNQYFYMDKDSAYWTISTEMIEPISRWIHGEHTSVICQEYEIFEGNMMRSLLKCAALLEEWMNMAIYCQHTDQIEKITQLKEKMLVSHADSLYLRL